MCRNKRGTMLLECVVYITLSLILGCVLIKIIFDTDYIYLKSVQVQAKEGEADALFINIERFINEDDVTKITVKDNVLIIYKGDFEKDFQKEEIFREGSRIMIKYYDIRNFEDYNTRNTLDQNIENFKVVPKGKNIYIYVQKGGREYIKCL